MEGRSGVLTCPAFLMERVLPALCRSREPPLAGWLARQ